MSQLSKDEKEKKMKLHELQKKKNGWNIVIRLDSFFTSVRIKQEKEKPILQMEKSQ